jgi:micrococcal nuclease
LFSFLRQENQVNNDWTLTTFNRDLAVTQGVISVEVEVDYLRVIDGDTIQINDKRIRFLVVDAPEVGEHLADVATERVQKLMNNAQTIELLTDELGMTCRFGRYLYWIVIDGYLLQEILAYEGLVEIAIVRDNVNQYLLSRIQAAQDTAIYNRVGLWY